MGKKQYLALVSLGDLTYDDDFLKKAQKIEGIKEIWPVVEIPVTIKIEDYTGNSHLFRNRSECVWRKSRAE